MSMTPATPAMGELRAEIDRIDAAILDLMERRVSLARSIAAAKPRTGALLLRPAREEQVVACLSARARRVPHDSIAAIWRELMGLTLQAQRPTPLVIHAPRHPGGVAGRASARFGATAPLVHADTPAEALDKARRLHAVAVIELDRRDGWWRTLADDPDFAVIDELRAPGGRGSALAVGRIAREHLAAERSWLVIEEADLATRLRRGEAVCPLAASGTLRLCIVEAMPALTLTAA